MSSKVKIDEDQVAEDARMIQQTLRWPAWPMLPLKKVATNELGFLIDFLPEGDRTVVIGNMFEVVSNIQDAATVDLAGMERRKYPTVLAMLEDGWRVD